MAEQRFDIAFDGSTTADADPALARQRLQSLFKLDEAGIARLFSGKPVFIKRDVDASTAAQFEKVFSQLGAVVRLIPLHDGDGSAGPPPADTAESVPAPSPDDQAPEKDTSPPAEDPLSLAPLTEDGFLEEPPAVKMPDLDLSHLSLVTGSDWTLEDCETSPSATRTPDTSHLSLTEIEPEPDTKDSGD
ncbi:hypothetical protein [Imhoffiella purpurea]|uniref:Uncharacterized protein n=1 Tax=Imhoffiella purpurea TaxID=1249627 RepID=W9VAQ1_9GAMM|nr:hypothetical protein [Imhoffiella purpurea]EXJ13991.1 hypothetical protein D779_3191 [Imhoffiella purpurea]